MQNYKIPRTEILKLYESSLGELSLHSIGQWLKSKTDNQYIVVPKENIKTVLEESENLNNATKKMNESAVDLKEHWL